MHDHVDGCLKVFAHRCKRPLWCRLQDHRLNAADGIVGGVRMACGKRPVVPGVHCGKHVECFVTPDFTEYEAIGAHT